MQSLQPRIMNVLATALVGLVLFGSPASAQTDDCASPTAISGDGAFPYDTTGLTTSALSFGGSPCTTQIKNDGFFVWTATASAVHVFSTCGTSYDSRLQMSSGSNCAATCIDEDDDSCTTNDAEIQISTVLTGEEYLIQVGAFGNAEEGPGTLTVTFVPPPPPNGTCATAQAVAGEGSFPYNRTGAGDSGFVGGNPGLCGSALISAPERDVFFAWTSTASGNYHIDNCGEGTDSEMTIHLGGDCSAVCVSDSNGAPCNPADDQLILLNGVTTGDVYMVQIGDWDDDDVSPAISSLNVTLLPPPPINDSCATPTLVSGLGSFAYDRIAATDSGFVGGDPVVCGTSDLAAPPYSDVFFAWTALSADNYRFESCSEGFDTDMNVHLGDDCSAVCVESNNNGDCANVIGSTVTRFNVTAGSTFLVQIGNWSSTSLITYPGSLDVVAAASPPANDGCSTPTPISGLISVPFDTTNATDSGFNGGGGECFSSFTGARDVFFLWTADAAGCYAFDTCGSTYDTIVSVHDGVDCAATCLGQNDDTFSCPGPVSLLDTGLTMAIGDQVLVQISGFDDERGPGTLNVTSVTCPPPPPVNDTCDNPTVIIGEGNYVWNNDFATTSGFNGGETPSAGGQPCFPHDSGILLEQQIHDDIFFAWTVGCDGDYDITTLGSNVTDTKLNIHTGFDCSATCFMGNDDIDAANDIYHSAVTITGALAGDVYLIQVGVFDTLTFTGDGFLNITRQGGPGSCEPSPIQVVCSPANPHHLGGSVTLASSTLGSGVGSGLHLEATGGPEGEFGFFLIGPGASNNQLVFNGVLCLDSPQGRYNSLIATNQGLPQLNSIGVFDASGVLQNLFGTSTAGTGFDVPLELPLSPAGQLIQPGDSWAFQLWFRDQIAPLPNPGSSANFSDAVTVSSI